MLEKKEKPENPGPRVIGKLSFFLYFQLPNLFGTLITLNLLRGYWWYQQSSATQQVDTHRGYLENIVFFQWNAMEKN